MNIEALYNLYSQHYLVDTDTRNIRKNTIFFALKGANFNGNKFAEEALSKGALYCVVDEEKYKTSESIIVVDDVLKTLQELSNFHRKKLNIPIISLTGSNGKTTTKELINIVLKEKFITNATKGNLNNHIGVPLTLLSMTPKTEIGIVEMGANHHKEIAFLSTIAEPDYGYITNFGKAHLEGFGSVEGVIEAKSELYDFLISNHKKIFVNQYDPIQVEKTKNANVIFLENSISFVSASPNVNVRLNAINIQTNLIGKYNYNNIACAITIGKYFGISDEKIKKAIESYISENNRSQVLKIGSNDVVLDAYNANPTSMRAALESFDQQLSNGKNKVVILGDMFELGDTSNKEHQEIVDLSNSLSFQKVFLIGEHFYQTDIESNNLKFSNFENFKDYLIQYDINDSNILIKGSRGMALERTLNFLN
ncbi:UDP-N-acetylmuramoyl-tripeptide--D-alanyl-D-alanine ligase [Tenacibaculum jejuense]|uniref:UDP-N-acetylmuramoyl-tripeptide--D-alanyl-D-alanine ligase n=1 Tax=Tenacibaculum jejuense TaxID=584609 RepID=A0A238U8K9_9FLAO|nr:UDP-N-acetylmuramoyl-tripeptide--D-alanyl-D-alanine ligase [Tenacibaculum jejuense]SNR14918.1 UDP-N-acetylmuramoyl-tripeptide--D-alanyl-D-alanine ligase [Tenacibaculum jejuense]